ncbi:MAG: MFS transporter [Deltaproteobacteria bacterium]|nr:MFS transporter [Deltaproteobacteria bacterium]
MHKNSLVTIFLVVFIDLVGFGMIIPILPYYAKSFGASATLLGVLMMCYSGMQFFFSPMWGRLSDRIGRRPVLLTCILGIAGSMVLLGFATSLFWLFAARLLAGLFGANISAATAYIADVTTPENRAKGMGMIGAAFGLGFLFGPAIGGFLSRFGFGAVAFAVAGLAFFNFLFGLFLLKEPSLSTAVRAEHRHHFDKKKWLSILSDPKTGTPIILFFLVTIGFAQMETTFALFLLARFGLDAQHAGYLLAGMAVIMVLVQGGGIGRLVKKFGETKLVWIGTSLMALGLTAASFSFHLSFFVAAMLILALGYSMTNPSLSSLASRGAAGGAQGATMGVYQSAGSLSRVLGPLLAGILFDHLGIQAPFWMASLFFIAALLMSVAKNRME